MDSHPIPQDVTGFQFKLIGNMTVKQFAYLAGGCIFAWIFYSIGISTFIKLPLILFFLLSGVSFAFLPIEGRPLDTMMRYFIKALFAPNQYMYQKQGRPLVVLSVTPKATVSQHTTDAVTSYKNLQTFVGALPQKPKNPLRSEASKLDEKELSFFKSLAGLFQPVPSTPLPPLTPNQKPHVISMTFDKKFASADTPPVPDMKPEQKEKVLEKEAVILKEELEQAKMQETQQPQQAAAEGAQGAHQKVVDLEKQLAEILFQKQQLEQQLVTLSRRFQTQNKPVFTPTAAADAAVPPITQNVRRISQGMGAGVGLPIAMENPNVVMGIVKDPRGNILPNVLVEVKDKEGNPVRAFKTNNLGQFASATSLLNGTYTLEFEDPSEKNTFDTVEITADGGIMQPLEVFSTDAREQLRKELFGQ